ncbi:MAG: hypothetical protein Q4G71_10570 [Pseudomonadota bacterium]|nr:hypothetical protein [Pseudomonadota bacterium]
MKSIDSFVGPGADPPPCATYGKGLQQRPAEKDTISCQLSIALARHPHGMKRQRCAMTNDRAFGA